MTAYAPSEECTPGNHNWKKIEEDDFIAMECRDCRVGTRIDMKNETPMEYRGPQTNWEWIPVTNL